MVAPLLTEVAHAVLILGVRGRKFLLQPLRRFSGRAGAECQAKVGALSDLRLQLVQQPDARPISSFWRLGSWGFAFDRQRAGVAESFRVRRKFSMRRCLANGTSAAPPLARPRGPTWRLAVDAAYVAAHFPQGLDRLASRKDHVGRIEVDKQVVAAHLGQKPNSVSAASWPVSRAGSARWPGSGRQLAGYVHDSPSAIGRVVRHEPMCRPTGADAQQPGRIRISRISLSRAARCGRRHQATVREPWDVGVALALEAAKTTLMRIPNSSRRAKNCSRAASCGSSRAEHEVDSSNAQLMPLRASRPIRLDAGKHTQRPLSIACSFVLLNAPREATTSAEREEYIIFIGVTSG